MTANKCQYCPAQFASSHAHDYHLASEHQRYEDGQPIADKTLRAIASTRQETLYLLINYPECRSEKPAWIWLKWLQIFSTNHILCYSQKDAGWMINTPGGVLKGEHIMTFLGTLESIRRRKQELQADDRGTHHVRLDDGTLIELDRHLCLLPSPKAQAVAYEREMAIRGYYAGRLDR